MKKFVKIAGIAAVAAAFLSFAGCSGMSPTTAEDLTEYLIGTGKTADEIKTAAATGKSADQTAAQAEAWAKVAEKYGKPAAEEATTSTLTIKGDGIFTQTLKVSSMPESITVVAKTVIDNSEGEAAKKVSAKVNINDGKIIDTGTETVVIYEAEIAKGEYVVAGGSITLKAKDALKTITSLQDATVTVTVE